MHLADHTKTQVLPITAASPQQLASQGFFAWQPQPTRAMYCLQVDGEQYCEPECPCGLKFCFACNARAHSPCTCDM